MAKFEVGDTIEWASQAAGTRKVKRGKVFAIVASGKDATAYLPRGVAPSRIKGTRRAFQDRYLVQTEATSAPDRRRGGRRTVDPYYYLPAVRTIDGEGASAGQLVRGR